MKKGLVLNSLIVFAICFLIIFIHQTYQDYEYYSVYSKEELAEFFSLPRVLLRNTCQAFVGSTMQLIISVPILAILENTNKKNMLKILIAIIITILVSIVYVIANIKIIF